MQEPPPSQWELPDPNGADRHGLVGVGADLEPGTVIAAYRSGMFPMPIEGHLGWWSPDPRGIIPLDGLIVSRSLRRSRRRYDVSIDGDFAAVLDACADPSRDGSWIDTDIREAYLRLHQLGWAHSVEVRNGDGQLVGGLYGIAVGRLFAGESMFHRATDASKVALAHLVDVLTAAGGRLLDVQWQTDHLATLGAIEISRREYLLLMEDATGDRSHDLFADQTDRPPPSA